MPRTGMRVLNRNSLGKRTWSVTAAAILITILYMNSDCRRATRQRTKPRWVQNSTATARMNESTTRCSARNLGFFTLLDQFTQRRIPSTSVKNCCTGCFLKEYEYAGYVADTCYCSKTIEDVASSKQLNAANSADLAKIKDEHHRVQLFKRQKCQTGFSEQSLKEAKVGCTLIPEELSDSMSPYMLEDASPSQCILVCEAHDRIFAIPIKAYNVCLCSGFSLFGSADAMRALMVSCSTGRWKSGQILVEVYQTFAEVESCHRRRFLKSKVAPATLLASLPGSGNTWLRHLIEVATGIYTGSAYNDRALYAGGFLGEYLPSTSGRTIVIKDHLFHNKINGRLYKSAISLVRNIYDAALADFARINTRDHTSAVDAGIYRSEEFRNLTLRRSQMWLDTQKYLLGNISSVVVVYFEDLLEDPVKQMRRISSFLPEDMVDNNEERLMCMLLDINGNFKRTPRTMDFDPFDAVIREKYSRTIKDMDALMRKHNQPPLPPSYFETYRI